ncbi:MAG: hypothetical protein RLZZ436_2851 [Planctomycetota bacterium]
MPAAVTIYIVHHPQSEDTLNLSRNLLNWFRLSDATGSQSDAGLPVWYRREIAQLPPPATKTSPRDSTTANARYRFDPEMTWDGALLNVVILLIDQHLVSSIDWCSAVENLLREYQKNPRKMLILPVALHDSFYRMTDLYESCNPIRLLDAPNPQAAAVTLRRLASEAIARRLRHTAPGKNLRKLEVFLSHAKADGREIAEHIRDSLSHYGQMDAWYDANELAVGDDWRKKIQAAALKDTAAMISIVTDHYSSRPWCRIEVEAARTPQPVDPRTCRIWKLQPAVAVHKAGNLWSRLMQALAGLPRIGWLADQPETSIAEIVDRLMLETLLGYAHRQVAKELKKEEAKEDIPDHQHTIYITWTPCPYTLAALQEQILAKKAPFTPTQITRIVYPGYRLRIAETRELNTVLKSFSRQTKLISFEEAFLDIDRKRSGRQTPAGPPSKRIKVSVSGIGNDSELQPHGIGCEHLEELLSRLTIALLRNNCQLILGGTLAKLNRTATTRLLDMAQTWLPEKTLRDISLAKPKTWPLQNYLQWPDCEQLTPEHHASLAGVCRMHPIYPPGLPPASLIGQMDASTLLRYGADSTRILRTKTTELADLRVIFGGLLRSTRGWMPGALEEAGLSIQKQQPLLILGGFGGAAADIAQFLSSTTAPVPESLQYSPDWVLRKAADIPTDSLRAIATFHADMLDALHSWRTLLHADKDMEKTVNKIPRGIVMECLKVGTIRSAVGLVIEGLRCLSATSARK